MATNRSFSAMLNEYLTDELLTAELIKRNWFFSNVQFDKDWKGGDIIVPFEGNSPNSVSFGSLTASDDIAQANYVRGKITSQPEAWASLILNQRDLQEHDGKMPESTFLRIIPNQVDRLMDNFTEALSYQFLGGPSIAKVTDDTNAATGVFVVDRVERFMLNQKVSIDDDNSSPTSAYVIAVNLNTSEVTFSASRGGSAADLSAYTEAQNAKFYHPGGETSTFTSMRSALLSSAAGGASTLHGQTKTAYPYLQSICVDGSGVTSSNIVEKLFDFYLQVRKKARGNATKLLMDYSAWGAIMKSQQIQKGGYKVINDPKKAEYGWWEMTIASTTNGQSLDIVAIQEHDSDIIVAFDPACVRVKSNGGIQKHKTPDGNLYYVVRNTTGYQYILDMVFRGEAMWTAPNNCGVLYDIPAL